MEKALEEKVNVGRILENAYLVCMAALVMYLFSWSTTFEFQWSEYFYDNIYYLLTGIILIRLGYEKEYKLWELLLLGGIYIVLFSAFKRAGYEEYTYIFLMICGAKGIPLKKILKVYVVALGTMIAAAVFFALAGQIDNLTYYQEGRRARYSFGLNYPTDFSAHIFYLFLIWFYIRGKKLKYIEISLALIAGIGVYWFCDARLNTICLIMLSFVFAVRKMIQNKESKSAPIYNPNKWIAGGLILSPVLCAGVMTWITMLYSPDIPFMEFLNRILSGRLKLGKKGMDIYGLTFWGQPIEMHGLGGTSGEVNNYFFLDSSYLYILLQFGLLVFLLLMFLWVCIGVKAYVKQDWILLWIIGFVAVQCMVEHHMTDITFVPFWMALTAELSETNEKRIKIIDKIRGIEVLHGKRMDKKTVSK